MSAHLIRAAYPRTGHDHLLTGLLLLLVFTVATLDARRPGARGRGVPEVKSLSSQEAMQRLAAIRSQRFDGDYVFSFTLEHMPKRGSVQVFHGTLWGRWQNAFPKLRLKIHSEDPNQPPREWLIHAGKKLNGWKANHDGEMQPLSNESLYDPLLPVLNYSAFDLAFQFLFWENAQYVGPLRVHGTPAHVYRLLPDPNQSPVPYSYLRIVLHAGHNTLMRADFFDQSEQLLKSLNVRSFKKVQDEWLVKEIDALDPIQHHKTRFTTHRAALNRDMPPSYFDAEWQKKLIYPEPSQWKNL